MINLLQRIAFPEDKKFEIAALRNMSSHGAILGEYTYSSGILYHHTLDNVISSLDFLLDYFEKNNTHVYRASKNMVSNLFINQMMTINTKLYIRESIRFIKDYPNVVNLDELKKKAKFYDNSSTKPAAYKLLNKKTANQDRCIKISIEGFDTDLMLLNLDSNSSLLDELLEKTGQYIYKEKSDGLVRYLELKKK